MTDVHHPLRRWLFESAVTQCQFAEQLGVAQSAISEWIKRKKYPSMDMMIRVRDATTGAVTADDFMPPYKGQRKRGKRT